MGKPCVAVILHRGTTSFPATNKNMTDLSMHNDSRTSSRTTLRLVFWTLGILIACFQAWAFRYSVSADSISYLDMSDGAMPGGDWHRLISGTWSPLYPLLLGLFRRALNISPQNEIVAAHICNVIIFVFAFACFEVFLTNFLRRMQSPEIAKQPDMAQGLWVFLSLAYSLFLWSSFSAITLRYLRPDMLMSGFVYLATGMLFRFSARPAAWIDYLKLGFVLGISFLAKEPMLPISVLMLAISFGESGAYNYLVNVDRAGPGYGWYLQNPGKAVGTFLHPPNQIFQSPPVYAFGQPSLVTHPLRFDPSEWMAGVRPRFALKRQIGEIYSDIIDLAKSVRGLILLFIALLLLTFTIDRKAVIRGIARAWPIWLIAIAACAMYVLVHVESRYVGTFFVLILCSIVFALVESFRALNRNLLFIGTIALVVSFLVPVIHRDYVEYQRAGRGPNHDALAAATLRDLGIQAGDHIARISPLVTDLGPERIGRLEVVAEVDFTHANEFWSAPVQVQEQILSLFASHGAKAVIATRRDSTEPSASGWKHLSGKYWVWLPQR
ncbi:MAG: hypothetical protein DMG93_13315 [Acidobacteria bacterium]|nr:MAG: hypothetical protein DMG93_13315 [Acidobacteriota bacterium]